MTVNGHNVCPRPEPIRVATRAPLGCRWERALAQSWRAPTGVGGRVVRAGSGRRRLRRHGGRAASRVPGAFTLSVAVLDLASPPGTEPHLYEGLRERYLPEVASRGRVKHRNSRYALYAAACMRGGSA